METEWNNFDALNVPADHPARDMQDTFWIKTDGKPITDEYGHSLRPVMRTLTSPVQIRYMQDFIKSGKSLENETIAIIAPGKVFRNEATDARHEAQFYQVEGLMIGKDVTLANLKGVLENYFSKFLERDTPVRFRSSFFPFTEPSVEVDMQCFKCDGKGEKDSVRCSVCSASGWIEIMGAGMVHPNVLRNAGLDPEIYQGFAFGGGLDRLIMLKTGIDDIRMLYNGDLRLVSQF
jgi:phenylalanyl-tRNA synthetase alpha chain